MKNILVLVPHTDDEILCYGTLTKFKEQGSNIDILAFSYPHELPKIKKEFENSCRILNANYKIIFDLPIRNLQSVRQELLECLIEYSKQKEYDLVFCPCSTDTHQDHEVIYNECFRAFKLTNIWGYFAPHNCKSFNIQIYSVLKKEHILQKMSAINCYQTQKTRSYFNDNYFEMLAKVNGKAIKQEYAEVFENIRSIMK